MPHYQLWQKSAHKIKKMFKVRSPNLQNFFLRFCSQQQTLKLHHKNQFHVPVLSQWIKLNSFSTSYHSWYILSNF